MRDSDLYIQARRFLFWFNKYYPCPSSHPDHPYTKLSEVIYSIENPVTPPMCEHERKLWPIAGEGRYCVKCNERDTSFHD